MAEFLLQQEVERRTKIVRTTQSRGHSAKKSGEKSDGEEPCPRTIFTTSRAVSLELAGANMLVEPRAWPEERGTVK
jgi:hypothetical protein